MDEGCKHEHEATFEEDVLIANAALAAGDLSHAGHHVACAVSSGADRAACDDLIDRFAAAAGADPLSHVRANDLWFGLAALRAELLARAGRHREAVPLLLAALAAVPSAPFLPWLGRWLATPGVLATLDPDKVAVQLVDCARQEPLGAALHQHARRIHEAHPDHDYLAFAAVKLHRVCWRYADAIAIARAAMARGPRPRTAIGLAGALREDGDLEGAIAAFREALVHDPGNAGIHLDLGDLHLELGRPADAVLAYDAALALEPDDPWAAPSRLYARWRETSADADADALTAYADLHPDNRRAAALSAELDAL